MITGERVGKFSTFAERILLFKRLDKLPIKDRDMARSKHEGAMAVIMDDEKYWVKLEEYIKFYEDRQLSCFPIVGDTVSRILENITPIELDKIL